MNISNEDQRITAVKELIELCPDFPKKGILFQNLFPVLRNSKVFQGLIDYLTEEIKTKYPNVDVIVGLDSRGFLFGPMIAVKLGVAFVPVRKQGKLPGETFTVEYSLEYGSTEIIINPLPDSKILDWSKLKGITDDNFKHMKFWTYFTFQDRCEIQKNSIEKGQKVVIVDDLLATGGTMKAACDLVKMAEAEILTCVVVIELKDLNGRQKLEYPLLSYIS